MGKLSRRDIRRVIIPLIVYVGIIYIVEMIAGVVWALNNAMKYIDVDNATIDYDSLQIAIMELINNYYFPLECLAAFISLFFLFRMFRKDYTEKRFLFNPSSIDRKYYLMIIPAAAFVSLSGNFLLNITDLTESSESFAMAESILFSNANIFYYVGICILMPICEELVYRGLIFLRLRQVTDVNDAIVFSSAIFGLMHGNMAQGIYSFVAGIFFAYLYEKYGSLKAPVLAHIVANTAAILISYLPFSIEGKTVLIVGGLLFAAAALLTAKWMDTFVNCEKVYMEDILPEAE